MTKAVPKGAPAPKKKVAPPSPASSGINEPAQETAPLPLKTATKSTAKPAPASTSRSPPKPSSKSAAKSHAASTAPQHTLKSNDKEIDAKKGGSKTNAPLAQHPLILRFHRLVDAFSKANDERDFYLDRQEGFLLYTDLDKGAEELAHLQEELKRHSERYCSIPKLSFYEQKKLMEGFVNEKIYDIDTKEKLGDIISSKNPRENFLEYLLDLHLENEKWQIYYHERFRIKIIEWLREKKFHFVFEEDLEMTKDVLERLKRNLFIAKAPKEVLKVRPDLEAKAKTYYMSEALNPRPKRGRPPKQIIKVEVQPQISADIFTTVPAGLYPFLFVPDLNSPSALTFSTRFGSHEALVEHIRSTGRIGSVARLEALTQKLSNLQDIAEESRPVVAVRSPEENTRVPQPTWGSTFDGNGSNAKKVSFDCN